MLEQLLVPDTYLEHLDLLIPPLSLASHVAPISQVTTLGHAADRIKEHLRTSYLQSISLSHELPLDNPLIPPSVLAYITD